MKKIISIIFITAVLLVSFTGRVSASQASFYLSPSQGNYKVGEILPVSVFIATEGVSINAAQGTLSFPAEKLRVLNVSKKDSIFTLWVQEPVWSNSNGEISFGGGLPNPGFSGSGGKIITIYFEVYSPGEVKLNFEKQMVTANNEYGTSVISEGEEANFSASPSGSMPSKSFSDTQPPRSFGIIADDEGDPTNPSPLLYFQTSDDFSDMSHYEVNVNDKIYIVKIGETLPYRLPKLPPGNHMIEVKAFDKAGNFIESDIKVKIESIPVPQVTTCPKTFESGEELLYIGGTALPNSRVIIYLEKEDGAAKELEVRSDGEGDWFFAKNVLIKSGIYRITAKTEDSRGAISDPSEFCYVKIILGGVIIGPWVFGYKVINIISLAVFAALLLILSYLIWRIRRTRNLIRIETLDLKSKFYKEYDELREDIIRQLVSYRDIKNSRELTEEERRLEKSLLKNLSDVKEVINKELKDIEEIS